MSSISIGVVVRQQTDGVRETLASLAANTQRKLDLTLLGDGLSSESLAEFKSLNQSSTEVACGTAACFNRLIHGPTANCYLLLEAGARVAPGWLDYLLVAHERHPACGLAGPSTNRALNAQCVFPVAGDAREEIDRLAKLCVRRFGNTCRPPEPLHSLSDFCYLVRRDVIQTIGEADEGYGTGPFWEMDYNRRAASAGFQGLWACAAYVHRAPATERATQEDILRAAANKRIYENKFSGLHLSASADDPGTSCPLPVHLSSTAILVDNQPAVGPVSVAERRANLSRPPLPSRDLHRELKELKDFQGIHAGETIVVCGCGVSLKMLHNPQRFITIGVNDVGRLFHPDYLVVVNPRNQFQDDRFRYVEESQAQAIFTQLDLGLRHPRVIRFNLGKRAGTDFCGSSLNYTSNSPYIALCLAIHMGARRVGVIGVDFTNNHFFAQTGIHALTRQLPQIDQEYHQLYAECMRRGIEVFNLSPESQVTAFPKLSLAEFEKWATPALTQPPAPKEGLRIVSYSTMPVAGVPALLARCIAARTSHECRTVWARNNYGNGVTFQGDVEWEQAPSLAAELLKSAELAIVHNGKVDPSHRPLLAGKPIITLAHNYMWNVDPSFVQQGFPGLVVGQYQATLPEFKQWLAVPNPVPVWEEAFKPGPKNSQLTICYTPSGKHESYPAGHKLYWHSKGYGTTMRVLESLAQRFPIRLEVIRAGQVSHAESLAMKKRSHIVIDECVTGSYHRNSLEGLALGCVVINGLGPVPQIAQVFRQCAGTDAETPFVCAGLENLERVLTSLVERGPAALMAQGRRNRQWMEQHWDFQQQWKRFWQPVIDNAIGSLRLKEAGRTMSSAVMVEAPRTKCEEVTQPLSALGVRTGLSVVVCHGGEERLPLLSASLVNLRQCSGVSEIIVIDIATAPFAENLARRWADKYIFLKNSDAFERARALNTGTEMAEFDLVLWKDNDLLLPPGFLDKATAEMRSRQLDYMMPHTCINYLSQPDSQKVMSGTQNPADCAPLKVFHPVRDHCGAVGMLRKSFFLSFGGIPENFRGWGGEDDAWWYKAQLLGRAAITQRQDQPIFHLFHPTSGAHGNGIQIASNPYYSQNVARLREIRSVRDRNLFLNRFPPCLTLPNTWRNKNVMVLGRSLGSDWPKDHVAKALKEIGGMAVTSVAVDEGESWKQLRQTPIDALVILDHEVAQQLLSDQAFQALWPKTVVACVQPDGETAGRLACAGAVLVHDLPTLQCVQQRGLRPWSSRNNRNNGDAGGLAVPVRVALDLIQPLSVILAGGQPANAVEQDTVAVQPVIPRPSLNVWMYWEGECPEWIRKCQQTIFAHAPEARLLSWQEFDKLWDTDRDIDLSRLLPAHRADFIRAFLLARFGGLWVDSDCVAMQSLERVLKMLDNYDFVAHRERSGFVSNGFIASRPGGKVAGELYRQICLTLRSRKPLGWISLGGEPLTQIMNSTDASKYEIQGELVQPICWSNPGAFFATGDPAHHEQNFNPQAICYMLSNTEVRRFQAANVSRNLLSEDTFFSFLINKTMTAIKSVSAKSAPVLTEWKQIPFGIEALLALRPQKVVDIGTAIGRWALLVRQYCEVPGCMLDRAQWKVRIEGIRPLAASCSQPEPFFYDRITNADEEELLLLLKQGADVIIFDDALEHWPRETAVKILDTALRTADYVLVSSFIASDARPSQWKLADLLGAGPVRFAIFNEHPGTDYGAFLLSDRDPRRLRSPSAMVDIFTRHLQLYSKVGDESLSGPGSSLFQTDEIRQRMPLLVEDIGARSFLDAPCGDFNWMKHVTLGVDQYIGIDVVSELIEQNQRKFGGPNRTFLNLDITRHDLPRVDLIFSRDCLVHFSYEDIFQAVRNFKKSRSKYLLTTTFPRLQANTQITTGDWRPLNLQLYPFNFRPPLKIINEKCSENGGRYVDKSLGLWELSTLP